MVPARVGKTWVLNHGPKAADDMGTARVATTVGREAAVVVKAASLRPMRRCHRESIAASNVRGCDPSSYHDRKLHRSLRNSWEVLGEDPGQPSD